MKKRVKVSIVFFISFLFIHGEGKPLSNKGIIKDLDETIVYKSTADYKRITESARYYADYYKDVRRDIISKALSILSLKPIDAVVEWCGGLSGCYIIVIIAGDSVSWIKWHGKKFGDADSAASIGQFSYKNELLEKIIKTKINDLSDYQGSKSQWASIDTPIYYMTIYENNEPQRTFYLKSDGEPLKTDTEANRKYYQIFDSLLKEIVNLLKKRSQVVMW